MNRQEYVSKMVDSVFIHMIHSKEINEDLLAYGATVEKHIIKGKYSKTRAIEGLEKVTANKVSKLRKSGLLPSTFTLDAEIRNRVAIRLLDWMESL